MSVSDIKVPHLAKQFGSPAPVDVGVIQAVELRKGARRMWVTMSRERIAEYITMFPR